MVGHNHIKRTRWRRICLGCLFFPSIIFLLHLFVGKLLPRMRQSSNPVGHRATRKNFSLDINTLSKRMVWKNCCGYILLQN